MREVVIVDAIRTPLGRRGGVLSKNHPVETSSRLLQELVKRNSFDPEVVDDVIYGCVSEVGAQSTNLARNVVLTAGWPYTIPGITLDRQCSSSQQAVHFAANQIGSGAHDIVVAGGTEFMSQIPLGANVGQGLGTPFTAKMGELYDLSSQGISAERIAEKWGISRGEADEFAVESQARAARAQKEGRFKNELIPVPGKKKIKKDDGSEDWEDATIDFDEGIRAGTTLEVLSALKPSFKENGVHHAGNSFGFSGDCEGVERAKAMAQDIWMRERRPFIWAEMRPDAMIDHMAKRPKNFCRATWAQKLTDETLDSLPTLDEQVAALSRVDMEAHMARRPAGYPRPDWARRAITEPAGGYDAYKKIVLES